MHLPVMGAIPYFACRRAREACILCDAPVFVLVEANVGQDLLAIV
jgi:hypothetical protein